MKVRKIYPMLLILGSFAFNAAVYPSLPARIPMHWNAAGKIDSWGNKGLWSVFGLPIAMIGMYILFLVLPRIDPFKKNYERFAGTYDVVVDAILAFFFAFNILVVASALRPQLNSSLAVNIGIGGLLVVLGNFMGRIKRNFFLGIRTPWTIANDEVWNKTHRFGGRLMVAIGLLNIFSAAVFRTETSFAVMTISVLGMTAAVVIYSYVLFQKIGSVQL